ncbi:MAG: DUF2155 domain-containing protein [Alphaproteobacteria bacterium]|nr:DUF2155 domain-containing protein [Alphaproteobacteria bacterium]
MRGSIAAVLALAAATPAAAEMTPEPVAVLQGLDKIPARVSKFEAPVGSPVQFGTLAIRVRDCEKSSPEDPPDSAAFLEIDESRQRDIRTRVFSGWMFASSPALSALEHPVYDVVLLDCKAASGSPRTTSGNAAGNEARPESASPSKR